MERWKALLGVVRIFGLGVLAGATLLTLAPSADEQTVRRHSHRSFSEFLSKTVVQELALDPQQTELILEIVKKNRAELASLRKDMEPRLREIYNQSIEEVRNTVSGAQLDGFERLLAERRAHREKHRQEREAARKKGK